jgi:transcriptional regulator with XRE-family HTH domain
LTPDRVGLPQTRRRRTPGLRREEVAELAGISATLYAWLEQARDVPVSRHTLDAIATALQLTADERQHIQNLGRPEAVEIDEYISPALRRMVLSLPTHAVYVLDHTWDIVLENAAARAILGPSEGVEPNLLKRVLFSDAVKSMLVDWESAARGLIERFQFDYAAHAGEPRLRKLLDELRVHPFFVRVWDTHRVRRYNQTMLRITHDTAGVLSFETTTYGVTESPGLRTLIFTPYDAETTRSMRELAEREWLLEVAS